MTRVILQLLIANAAVFLLFEPMLGKASLQYWFALWPIAEPVIIRDFGPSGAFAPWQLVSYAFLHANWPHLFFNMFALWMFGTQVEAAWGSQRFTVYYFACVIGAGLVQLVVASLAAAEGDYHPTVGASGGLFGVLLAFGMMYPNQRIMLLLFPVPVPAKYFVLGYGALELVLGVTGTAAGVAHFAHVGGMVFGFLLIQYWRGRLPIKPRRRMFW